MLDAGQPWNTRQPRYLPRNSRCDILKISAMVDLSIEVAILEKTS